MSFLFDKGETTQTSDVAEWLKPDIQANVQRGQEMSRIGYTPDYGPSVAAMSPLQQAAMRNTSGMMRGYGMSGGRWNDANQNLGMPQARDYGNGMMAYSSGDLYDQSMAELQRRRPGQYQAITDMFIDPVTGAESGYDQRIAAQALVQAGVPQDIAQAAISGDGDAITALGSYGFNREKLAQFLADIPKVGIGTGLLSLLGESLQEKYQKEMEEIAAATNGTGSSAGSSSNASRQSSALSSAGQSWGSPTVGSGGGNVSRGYSTGGW